MNLWTDAQLEQIRFLADLRAMILERQTKRVRCPKWKFRLAEDLIIEIQPQASTV